MCSNWVCLLNAAYFLSCQLLKIGIGPAAQFSFASTITRFFNFSFQHHILAAANTTRAQFYNSFSTFEPFLSKSCFLHTTCFILLHITRASACWAASFHFFSAYGTFNCYFFESSHQPNAITFCLHWAENHFMRAAQLSLGFLSTRPFLSSTPLASFSFTLLGFLVLHLHPKLTTQTANPNKSASHVPGPHHMFFSPHPFPIRILVHGLVAVRSFSLSLSFPLPLGLLDDVPFFILVSGCLSYKGQANLM